MENLFLCCKLTSNKDEDYSITCNNINENNNSILSQNNNNNDLKNEIDPQKKYQKIMTKQMKIVQETVKKLKK